MVHQLADHMPRQFDFGPPPIWIDDIPVQPFDTPESFYHAIVGQARNATPGKPAIVASVNIHATNMAHDLPEFMDFTRNASITYCDGAGIRWGAFLQQKDVPLRLTVADWFDDFIDRMAQEGLTVYLLGGLPARNGKPAVAEQMLARQTLRNRNHSIVGVHHGYVNDPAVNEAVLAEIKAKQPDLVMVGMGMPIQERWVLRWKNELPVKIFFPIGAAMDYLTGQVPRAPQWIQDCHFEWLFRLMLEPRRMFKRYVIGNPRFIARVLAKQYLGYRPKAAQ